MILKHILAPTAGTAWRCFLKSQETSSKCSSQASKSEALREPISNNLSWEGDSVMLAACLQGYEEVIRDNFVWFGRWWMSFHKRSCCSTWVPRRINMEFAKDSRKNSFLFAKNGHSRIKEFWPTMIYHISIISYKDLPNNRQDPQPYPHGRAQDFVAQVREGPSFSTEWSDWSGSMINAWDILGSFFRWTHGYCNFTGFMFQFGSILSNSQSVLVYAAWSKHAIRDRQTDRQTDR